MKFGVAAQTKTTVGIETSTSMTNVLFQTAFATRQLSNELRVHGALNPMKSAVRT